MVLNKRRKQVQNAYLTEDELIKERNPVELYSWVDQKLVELSKVKEAKQNILLREGLFNQFFHEVKPLAIFSKRAYQGRGDIKIKYILGDQGYDAIIEDYSESPPSKTYIELTCAIEGHNHSLRMEYFLQHGHVSLYAPIKHKGTKRKGRKIDIENNLTRLDDHLNKTFELIKQCAERKSGIVYGRTSHILIIAFDDIDWYGKYPEGCTQKLNDFIKKEVFPLPLDFKDIYVVGIREKAFSHFPIMEI